jgi:enolase
MQIKNISSRKILNSGAKYTIETKIELNDGSIGIASVPGGISRGEREVVSIDPDHAIQNIENIKGQLLNVEFSSQRQFDELLIKLDGTHNKSNLGGNTLLSLSIAFCKASAKSQKLETYQYIHTVIAPEIPLSQMTFTLPQMMMLIFEGGVHGDSGATIQEFMAVVKTVQEGVDIYTNLRNALAAMKKSTNVGAEGAFSPEGFDNFKTLKFLNIHIKDSKIALDIAASEIKDPSGIPDYETMLDVFPIVSIEDPYNENDWIGWENFSRKYNDKINVVTDDLTTTNLDTLRTAIQRKVGNSILVKPNQIGTVTETLDVISEAQKSNWKVIISHRGTDTNDDFIADLAIGVKADYTKFGSPARGERVAKYNRLTEIIS